MMTAQPNEPLTQAEFRVWELEQEAKHEYVDGFVEPLFGDRTICGFAGGTVRHGRIAMELAMRIGPLARPCRTYGSDVLIETWRSSRYADVFVTCDDRDRDDDTAVHHPKLIIEVLSESTAKIDLGPKMREYQSIAELEEYVTIDSRKRWAQIVRRDQGGVWKLEAPAATGDLELRSIGATIDLEALYDIVGMPPGEVAS